MSDFVFSERHVLMRVGVIEAGSAIYSLDAAAALTGVHPEMLRYYCRAGLLGAQRSRKESEPTFDDDGLYQVRRIEHFRRRHGVNRRALALLCELWREVERLQTELRFLRGP
jgi:DNA-binding transcriptional MerR regulator